MSNTDVQAIIEDSDDDELIPKQAINEGTVQNMKFEDVIAKLKESNDEIEPAFDDSPGKKSNRTKSVKNGDSFEINQQSINNDELAESGTDNMAYTKSNKNVSKNDVTEENYDEDFEDNVPEESPSPKKSTDNKPKISPEKPKTISKPPIDKTPTKPTNDGKKDSTISKSKPPISREPVQHNKMQQNPENVQKGKENNEKKQNSQPARPSTSKSVEKKNISNVPAENKKIESKPKITKPIENKNERSNEKSIPQNKPLSKSVEKKPQNVEKENKKETKQTKSIKDEEIVDEIQESVPEEDSIPSKTALKDESKPENKTEIKEKLNFRIRPSSGSLNQRVSDSKKAASSSNKDLESMKKSHEEVIQDDFDGYQERLDRKALTSQGFKIKPVKQPPKHTDILKQIYQEYQEKEKIIQEKDANIYAIEEAGKRVKPDSQNEKSSELESNWIGNGLGMKEKKPPQKPPVKKSNVTRDLAANFLSNLEKKIGPNPKEKIEKKEKKQPVEEDGQDLFNLEKNEGGDEALPDMENNNDLNATENKSKPDKSKNIDSKENTLKKEKKGEETKNKDDSKWSYQIGTGVLTDYEKTQKEKVKANQQRFSELFKNEKKRKQEVLKENLKKQKEVLIKERENNKKKQIEMAKPIKVEEKKTEKDSGVLQVQTIYEEENKRDKNLRDKKEIADMKEKLKILREANADLKKSLFEIEERDKESAKLLEELTSRKAVISLGKNTFTTFGFVPSQKSEDIGLESTEETSKSVLSQDLKNFAEDNFSPVELVVNKIVDQGFTLETLYQTLDSNGDGVLTLKEIKEGFEKLNLELTRKEVDEIIRTLDKNTDGLISLYEFKQNLTESLELRREYKAIMGDLDRIANPLVLEERILDLEIRKKVIQEELKKVTDDIVFDEKEYNEKLNQLKKYDNLAGPKEDTQKTGLDQYKETILKTKIELQDLVELQNRTVLLQEDRINDVKENISNIQNEITKTIQEIYKAKRKLREKIDDEQKDQIRKLFLEKLYSDLDKELESNEQGLNINIMKLIEEREKYKTGTQEEQIKEKFNNYAKDGAARKIQTAYRSKKMRAEFKEQLSRISRAKTAIILAYRRFKRRNKCFVAFTKIKALFIKRMKAGIILIKEKAATTPNTDRVKSSLVYTESDFGGTEALPTMHIKHDSLSFYEKYLIYSLSERFVGFKQFLGKRVNLEIPELKGKCKICEKNRIQRICRKCELSLFCQNCFNQSHGRSRNHLYVEVSFDIKSGKYNLDEVFIKSKIETWNRSKIAQKVPEKIEALKLKYQENFKDLLKHFKIYDSNFNGYFEQKNLEFALNRKISNKEDISTIVEFALNYCILSVTGDIKKIDYVALTKIIS